MKIYEKPCNTNQSKNNSTDIKTPSIRMEKVADTQLFWKKGCIIILLLHRPKYKLHPKCS